MYSTHDSHFQHVQLIRDAALETALALGMPLHGRQRVGNGELLASARRPYLVVQQRSRGLKGGRHHGRALSGAHVQRGHGSLSGRQLDAHRRIGRGQGGSGRRRAHRRRAQQWRGGRNVIRIGRHFFFFFFGFGFGFFWIKIDSQPNGNCTPKKRNGKETSSKLIHVARARSASESPRRVLEAQEPSSSFRNRYSQRNKRPRFPFSLLLFRQASRKPGFSTPDLSAAEKPAKSNSKARTTRSEEMGSGYEDYYDIDAIVAEQEV